MGTALFAAASMAMSIYQSIEARKDAKAHAVDTSKAADAAAEIDLEALKTRESQVEDQGELDVLERQRQQHREAGKIRVAQSEAGVFGNSQIQELANSMMQSGYDISLIKKNVGNEKDQIALERKAVAANTKSRKNQAKANVPSGLMTGLQIGSTAASGMSDIQGMKKEGKWWG